MEPRLQHQYSEFPLQRTEGRSRCAPLTALRRSPHTHGARILALPVVMGSDQLTRTRSTAMPTTLCNRTLAFMISERTEHSHCPLDPANCSLARRPESSRE